MQNHDFMRAVQAERSREREHAMFLTRLGVGTPRSAGRMRAAVRGLLARLRRPPMPVPLDLLPALERREAAIDLTRFSEPTLQEQGTAS